MRKKLLMLTLITGLLSACEIAVRTDARVCPTIQLQTNAIMTRYKNGDCWTYLAGAGQSYKCY